MRQRDDLQTEIADLQREIMDLKTASSVAPIVLCYEFETWLNSAGWITIFFKDGKQPVITEFSTGTFASVMPLTPTKLNGVDIQSVSVYSQSQIFLRILSTRPIDHVTKA